MPKPLRIILTILAGGLLAALTGLLLAPFLPPSLARALAVGLVFGAFTFLEETYLKKNGNALRQAGIAAVATVGILLLLELIW